MHEYGDLLELRERVGELADDALPPILFVRVLDLDIDADDAEHGELELRRFAWGIGCGADEHVEDDVAVEVEGVGLHGDQAGFLVDLATDAEEVEAHFGNSGGAAEAGDLGWRMVSEPMEDFIALIVDIADEGDEVVVTFAHRDGFKGVV